MWEGSQSKDVTEKIMSYISEKILKDQWPSSEANDRVRHNHRVMMKPNRSIYYCMLFRVFQKALYLFICESRLGAVVNASYEANTKRIGHFGEIPQLFVFLGRHPYWLLSKPYSQMATWPYFQNIAIYLSIFQILF